MKILVTGGAGFIGSHLVDKYIELGHEVFVLDDLSTGSEQFINPRAKFINMSLSDLRLEELIKDIRPNLINHHAAQANVRVSLKHPMFDMETNLVNTTRLFYAAGVAGVKKIIFASSGGAVYGNSSKKAISERCSEKPISPYGINKLAAEHFLRMIGNLYKFNWTILRYSNVYGPRKNPHQGSGIISIIIEKVRTGKNPIFFGDGEQIRDYIHVDDVVEANMLFSNYEIVANQVFNVGSGRGITLNQLLKIINVILHKSIPPIYAPANEGDLVRNVLNIEKLKKIGWIPKVTLEKGIEKLASVEYDHRVPNSYVDENVYGRVEFFHD